MQINIQVSYMEWSSMMFVWWFSSDSKLLRDVVPRDLVLAKGVRGLGHVVAPRALVDPRHVLGLDVPPAVRLVAKVLNAGRARPNPVNPHHVLHQGIFKT